MTSGGIKRWRVGGPIQGPLHVLRDLMQEHRFKADEVEKAGTSIRSLASVALRTLYQR